MKSIRVILALIVSFVISVVMLQSAMAAGVDDPARLDYYKALKGKKIVFIPVAMGSYLGDGWAATIKGMATPVGMDFSIRDPNYNVDAGAQALTSLISQKPDVIIVHNPDVNSYAKLIQRAEAAGIYVISVNMRSSMGSSAFVGADYTRIGEIQAEQIVKHCGKGTSGKVAIVQGVITSGASGFMRKGIENVLSKHPEIKIVADQAADWDATKARNITATILQSNPDICGIMGAWDVMDTGTAAAVQEFNKRAKRDKPVYLNTSGGGAKFSCDKVKDGTFSEVVAYNVPGQGRDIFSMISYLIQSKVKPGLYQVSIISPLYLINKQNLSADSCWDPAEWIKK